MEVTLTQQRICFFLLIALTATIVLSPLAVNQRMLNEYDYVNHIASIIQAKMAIMEGQFPLRSMPFISSWRYPLYQFYSPSSYWLAGIIYKYFITGNPYTAYKATLWCALIFGGVYMYRLASWITESKQIGLLSSVAYLSSPYYIIVLDHLGAFSEAVALGMLPAVLFYTFRFFYFRGQLTFLLAALGWYLLATTHIITFVYASVFISLLLFLMTIKTRRWKSFFAVGFMYSFSCVLAAWFLGPILLFQKILVSRTVFGSNFDLKYHVYLSDLLSPTSNVSHKVLMNGNLLDLLSMLHPSLGMPLLFGVGCCIYLLLTRYRFANNFAANLLGPLLSLLLICLLIVLSFSHLWSLLPSILKVGQYRWRLLGQANWMATLLFALATSWLLKDKITNREIFLGCCLIIFSTSTWLRLTDSNFIPSLGNSLVSKPIWAINADMYLINEYANLDLIGAVDAKKMHIKLDDEMLHYVKDYQFPETYFSGVKYPSLLVKGVFKDVKSADINVFVNGKFIKKFAQQSGSFMWEIPILPPKKIVANKNAKIHFTFDGSQSTGPLVTLDSFFLSGYQNPETTMRVNKTESYCHSQNQMMVCIIPPLAKSTLVELPFNYYPKMLSVYLNNKKVTYTSVLTEHLVVGLNVKPGKVNIIKLKFTGLFWPNVLSLSGCIIMLLMLIAIAIQKIFLPRKEIYASPIT